MHFAKLQAPNCHLPSPTQSSIKTLFLAIQMQRHLRLSNPIQSLGPSRAKTTSYFLLFLKFSIGRPDINAERKVRGNIIKMIAKSSGSTLLFLFYAFNRGLIGEAIMKTPDIPTQQMPVQHIDPLNDRTAVASNNQAIDPDLDKAACDGVKRPSQDRIKMSMQQRAKARFEHFSRQIHQLDKTMETIDTQLGEMRASLERIVKQYPPYPPESAERIENLRRFSTLRKIIDQLTIPHQVDGLEKRPKDQQRYFGNNGLRIPEIGPDAGDDQILEAFNKVKVAQSAHQQRRRDFLADVHQAFDRIGQ